MCARPQRVGVRMETLEREVRGRVTKGMTRENQGDLEVRLSLFMQCWLCRAVFAGAIMTFKPPRDYRSISA